MRLLVVASVPLSKLPRTTKSGLVAVPEQPRQQAEEAIRAYANTIATVERTGRSIASPLPYAAFEPESDKDRAWLKSKKGIDAGFGAVPGARPAIQLTDEIIQGLADRLDGVELCAEAQSQQTASGRFREFVRLFERAFAQRAQSRLVEPLWSFLQSNRQGFTKQEVAEWLHKKRHWLTHGQQDPYLLTWDVAPSVGRVEQAAYDVLFNKAEWRSPSSTRRDLWSPETGTSDAQVSIFLTAGAAATFEFQTIDGLGGFPADLSASLTSLPEGWWVGTARQSAS